MNAKLLDERSNFTEVETPSSYMIEKQWLVIEPFLVEHDNFANGFLGALSTNSVCITNAIGEEISSELEVVEYTPSLFLQTPGQKLVDLNESYKAVNTKKKRREGKLTIAIIPACFFNFFHWIPINFPTTFLVFRIFA